MLVSCTIASKINVTVQQCNHNNRGLAKSVAVGALQHRYNAKLVAAWMIGVTLWMVEMPALVQSPTSTLLRDLVVGTVERFGKFFPQYESNPRYILGTWIIMCNLDLLWQGMDTLCINV